MQKTEEGQWLVQGYVLVGTVDSVNQVARTLNGTVTIHTSKAKLATLNPQDCIKSAINAALDTPACQKTATIHPKTPNLDSKNKKCLTAQTAYSSHREIQVAPFGNIPQAQEKRGYKDGA